MSVPRRSARLIGKRHGPPLAKSKPTLKKQRRTIQVADNIYLQVNRRALLLPNPPTQDQPSPEPSPPPQGTTGNITILTATLPDLRQFADDSVDWLLHVARLLLDPRGNGTLYTFQSGTVQDWLNKEADDSWRPVILGTQLVPTIYEYRRATGQSMEPTRICAVQETSRTIYRTQRNQEFGSKLLRRHSRCIVSQLELLTTLRGSHLIPRYLGDNATQYLFQRFTCLSTPVTSDHPSVGVTINLILGDLMDTFELGFWYRGNNKYEVHLFEDDGEMNLHGLSWKPNDTIANVHRHQIVVGDDPPAGVFDWHYAQCILRRFSTDEYRGMDNITHFAFETPDEVELGFDPWST